MRFYGLVLVAFLLLSISKINAQNYELGKVTIEELQQKVNAKDTTAAAAVLFKKGKTFFTYTSERGFTANHVYEFKIKIYKKEGLNLANHKVSYYIGYENRNDDSVSFSNAATYNLENGVIVKTKLNSEGVFNSNINKYWNQAMITLPNVKVGSVIEFKYVVKSENLIRLPDFDFQYPFPVAFFEYKTEIPEFLIYKTILIGQVNIKSSTEVVESKQIFATGYKQINSLYTSENIPALKNEKFVDNISNYSGSIQNELERKRFPSEPIVDLTKTWEGVATSIYENESFGKEIKFKNYYSEDLKILLANVNLPLDRLNAIFNFVQNRMNWNKENGYFVDKGVKKAYEARTGNVAEINFILISMLKTAGIEVSPVLVSTLENGVPVFPNRTVFNYVIAAAEIDGKKILLNAANKFTTLNVLPLNLLNWKGRLIKQDGSSQEIDLIPESLSKGNYIIIATIDPELKQIQGQVRIRRADYSALQFRELKVSNNDEDAYLEKLENDLSKIEINDYLLENKNEDLSKPVVEKFNFSWSNAYDMINGKIFLKPLLFFTDTSNPLVQEERQMPVYFGYPDQNVYNVFLKIPDGYVVESLPKPIRISTEGKDGFYIMNMNTEENKIQIQVTKGINKAIFAASDYDMLKEFFQKIIVSQNEKIVLKKI